MNMALKELMGMDDLHEVWETSMEKPVLLFKQSTTGPISADAFAEFQTFVSENNGETDAFFVKLREARAVYDEIAEDLGIRHQAPQLVLVKKKEAVWNTSHTSITKESIKNALQNV